MCAVPPISFSSINCNSLNASCCNKDLHKLKIYGITKLKTDVIFLSDIRLSNRAGVTDAAVITRNFLVNPYCSYKFYYNSTSNKRGVGILIKNSLSFSDLQCIKDPEENYLLLRLVLKGKPIIIGSIYGPNTNDRNFFTRLGDCLINEADNFPIILGGDWNCTLSTDAVQ
jgi:exonuclease III